MWVFRAGIYIELLVHGVAELVLREHAFYAGFDHFLGAACAHFSYVELLQTAGITGVMLVFLGDLFIAGEADLVGVDDDDEVAGINMGRVFRAVLAPEDSGDPGAQAAEHLAVSVDHKPIAVDFFLLDGPGLVA